MPDVVRGGVIDLAQLVLRWLDPRCCFCGSISGNVAKEDHGIIHYSKVSALQRLEQAGMFVRSLTQLSEFPVGNQQGSQGLQTFQCLSTILLSRIFIERTIDALGVGSPNLLSFPDKFLQDVAVIFGKEEQLGLFNGIPKILYQTLAFARKVLGGGSKPLGIDGRIEGYIALLVLRQR
jgi:hypothetical protein